MIEPNRDPTRVVWRRCLAYAADLLLMALVLAATLLAAGDWHTLKSGCPTKVPSGHACFELRSVGYLMRDRAFVWFAVALVGLVIFVFIVPQSTLGCSPGKALLGVRVVRPDGSSPGLLRSFLRVAAWGIDGLAIGLPVGLWLVIVTNGHRRVGDFIAGTYVVRSTATGHPVQVPARGWVTRQLRSMPGRRPGA
jgi:uncharacterized RDD family membrane protein YckC